MAQIAVRQLLLYIPFFIHLTFSPLLGYKRTLLKVFYISLYMGIDPHSQSVISLLFITRGKPQRVQKLMGKVDELSLKLFKSIIL